VPKPLKSQDPGHSVDAWVGVELRHLRMKAGLSQSELAEFAKVDSSLISKLELGNRGLQSDTARRLDEVLRTDGFFQRVLPLVAKEKDKRSSHSDNRTGTASATGGVPVPGGMLESGDSGDVEEGAVHRRELLAVAVGLTGLAAQVAEALEERLEFFELDVDDDALQQVDHAVKALARSNRPAAETLRSAQQVAARAARIADRTRRPAKLAAVHRTTGQLHALMASSAFDLGAWDACDRISNAAGMYASLGEDRALQAWVLGLQASAANWRADPDAALVFLGEALALAPEGEAVLRVRAIMARSYALLGDTRALGEVLREIEDVDVTSSTDRLSSHVGGEFSFDAARAAACLATACLDSGMGAESERWANRALEAMNAAPFSKRSVSQVAGARIDLATAQLLSGRASEALAILESVMKTSLIGNASIAGRLRRVRGVLAHQEYQRDDRIRTVIDVIDGSSSTDQKR
jgi:transcriptional regulator with XRE-family HTH domain